MPPYQPMRLLRIAQPFDDPDFIFELKLDGFRGVAFVNNGRCQLVSRNGHTFNQLGFADARDRSLAPLSIGRARR